MLDSPSTEQLTQNKNASSSSTNDEEAQSEWNAPLDGNNHPSGEDRHASEKDEFTAKEGAGSSSNNDDNVQNGADSGLEYNEHPACIDNEENDEANEKIVMKLNVAFEALEMMRTTNLQVEFGEDSIDPNMCVTYKRDELNGEDSPQRRVFRFRPKTEPCLACSTPVCSKHRSKEFGKENITICTQCYHLFSPEAIVETIFSGDKTNYLLEVYDRTLLILKYSLQYIDEISQALESNTRRNNKIGLGSSAAGLVSGVIGVTAAVTIFTPVGPPLLLASVLFGGSATAAAAGSEAVNYRCEPNKMADKIISLHAIVVSISKVPAILDQIRLDSAGNEDKEKKEDCNELMSSSSSKSSRYLHITRAAMHSLKPLTAGALSAISIITEAREMKGTIEKIQAGNPCDKAGNLRTIKEDVRKLPGTTHIADQLKLREQGG